MVLVLRLHHRTALCALFWLVKYQWPFILFLTCFFFLSHLLKCSLCCQLWVGDKFHFPGLYSRVKQALNLRLL